MKGLVLGLGNDILSDDGVGLVVVRRLRERLGSNESVDFVETNEMGLSLLDFIEGYDWAVIVDSIITGDNEPGTLTIFDRETFNHPRACNPHHMGLDEIIDMAERMDLDVPKVLFVAAIEVKDPFSFGEKLTNEIEKIVPKVTTEIETIIKEKCLAEK
jgi:hydrogenase maturation protease